MALWASYEIVKGIANKYKQKHPKRSHFKIVQHKNIFYRMKGINPNQWWIYYKPFEQTILGPFDTKTEAEGVLDNIWTMITSLKG